jgi:hypothetical protein
MNRYFILIVLLAILIVPNKVSAQKKPRAFIDTLDNALDISYYLYNLHGLLPIVSPITEPAVGYGAAAAGLFFISKNDTVERGFKMPDVVGIAGGYTENATWFVGGGYIGFWRQDRIRYRGVLGYGNIKLKYYGNGSEFLSKNPAKFSIESYFFLQQAIFRLGDTRFLLGGRYMLGKSTITFFEDSKFPIVNPKDKELTNSGIGLIAEYENFNNIFSPTKGLRVNATYDQFLTVLGSDRDYGRLSIFAIDYFPVIQKRWIAGFRAESKISFHNTPFYMLPFVYLRGVPAMRYQGELTALVETEQEFIITRRWSLVGFGGIAKAFESKEDLSKNVNAWNSGIGFRYLLARTFGLKMGLDVARGPEQWAVYVVFGNSWLK